ncbi:pirin family protein [Aureispira anguillae]|uniref:Pirin family protein n=1 Tax=Aureispira anguillae TaxID=2864201 RepID=A0A915YE23_9BACT|nr:pirin family protein [Aureispira anguillae]BDS11399.1 pirin family protein [Aureispira anguillae]
MKKSRRNFLGKFGLGLASVLGGTYQSLAKNDPSDNLTDKTKKMKNQQPQETNPILSIKPLGFQWETADPFLFCVHHDDKFPKGNEQMEPDPSLLEGRNIGQDFMLKDGWRMYHGETIPGFPGHPHRGFETITVVRKGMVDHADSLGGAGRYGDGDVQWMTAGKGVQHSEMFPLIHQDKDNHMELFQIWINLPKKDKMVNAHYKMLWGEDIPNYNYKDAQGKLTEVEVIAGVLDNQKAPAPPPNSWAAEESHEVAVWNIRIEGNGTWTLPKGSAAVNRTLYFYEGDHLELGGTTIASYHAVVVKADQELSIKVGDSGAKILLLQGKPINEPVVQHGPFVMNTRQEIQQAFADYQQTRFGGWPWARYDQVHARNLGRFAKHADGTEEIK